tara:strand:+ start:282 stop:383 length:102 start_codon:yes stop_codon:yes gene_type:complete
MFKSINSLLLFKISIITYNYFKELKLKIGKLSK